MTDDKHPLQRALEERRARGAAIPGGRLVPQGGRLVRVPHERPEDERAGRQVIPHNEPEGD